MTTSPGEDYPRGYFERFSPGSSRSASIVLPIVQSLVNLKSVADFGCGAGEWLAVWQRLGVDDVVGCDGPHVPVAPLRFGPTRFVAADLSRPLRLDRRFDLVQSLEVAEHLPPGAAATFVDTLVSHASVVLFSAAPPGQGGIRHLNEQPAEYWRDLFFQRGFFAIDAIRPLVANDKRVEPWYRYNSFLFADRRGLARLNADLTSVVVPEGVLLREYAPPVVRLRNSLLRHVPEPVVTRIASQLWRVTLPWRT